LLITSYLIYASKNSAATKKAKEAKRITYAMPFAFIHVDLSPAEQAGQVIGKSFSPAARAF
jgi:hypothetical protein